MSYQEEAYQEIIRRATKKWSKKEQEEFHNKIKTLLTTGAVIDWDEQLHIAIIDIEKL